jgi:5,10-methenyltetrahydrofolate synthetase
MDESGESRIPRDQLRKLMLARRSLIGAEARQDYDLALARNLQQVAVVRAARVLALYWPIRGEPDLRPFAAACRAAGQSVALPVTGPRGGELVFCAWRNDDELETGPLRIRVPTDKTPVVPDCLIIPCLGFCIAEGRPWRLGYGAGYYDRTLARRPVPAVGVGYDESETDQFTPDTWDAPLTVLVTPSRVIDSIASP